MIDSRSGYREEVMAGGISMELSGKGSFQEAKLQRTTVCSHSARDMAAMRSIKSQHENTDP